MTSRAPVKFLKHDGEIWRMHWRHPASRYGCDRSRHLVSRFPDQTDRIARWTVEAVSPLTKSKTQPSQEDFNEQGYA